MVLLDPAKLLLLAGVPLCLWLYRRRTAARWARRVSGTQALLRYRAFSALAAAQMGGKQREGRAATLLAGAAAVLVVALAGPVWPGGQVHLAVTALLVVSGVTLWEMGPSRATPAPPGAESGEARRPFYPPPLEMEVYGPPTASGTPRHPFLLPSGYIPDDRREYAPGDEMRFIDWKATARTGKTLIKYSATETDITLWLTVDCSASTQAGIATPKKNLMVQLCSILARAACQGDSRFGLALFTTDLEAVVAPRQGKGHAERVVASLQRWNPANAGTDIPSALATLGKQVRGHGAVFLVSDFADPLPGGFEKAVRGLQAKRQRVVAVRVSDPVDERLPDLGAAMVENPETGEALLLDTSDRVLQEEYRKATARHQAELRLRLAILGVPLIQLKTTDPPRVMVERMSRLRGEIRAAASAG